MDIINNKPKATIVDVAKYAQVAVSTVSRVINNKSDVKDETRKKVIQAMKELDFIPNTAARSLGRGGEDVHNGKSSFSIGLVVFESIISDPYFIHILKGVESELALNGFNCIFSQLKEELFREESSSSEFNLFNLQLEGRFDGIIAVGINNRKAADLLKKTNLPIVLLDSIDFGDDFNYIKADNIGGARKAINHLISLGHKRIGYIRGDEDSWFFNELEQGYYEALLSEGLSRDPDLIVFGGNSLQGGYTSGKELMELENPPTAIFTNDITAVGVMKAIKEKGINIPQDISVVGFDDIDVAQYVDPVLTTIQVPKHEMGVFAARRIIECIKNEKSETPMKVALATKLVIRKSADIYN